MRSWRSDRLWQQGTRELRTELKVGGFAHAGAPACAACGCGLPESAYICISTHTNPHRHSHIHKHAQKRTHTHALHKLTHCAGGAGEACAELRRVNVAQAARIAQLEAELRACKRGAPWPLLAPCGVRCMPGCPHYM